MVKEGHDGFVSVVANQFPQTEQMLMPFFTHSLTVSFKCEF